MINNELIGSLENDLGFKNIKIKRIQNHKGYLLIVLDNGQKFLTNDKEVYDVSDYEYFVDIFSMGDKICAVLSKFSVQCLVDLETMEILFEDRNAYSISKEDERALCVIIGMGNAIYNIETKKYLPVPNDYEFERSLENGMYVFCETRKTGKKFYDRKRCVVNANGETLLTDVEGQIYYNDNHLIIVKKNELGIVELNGGPYDIQTLKKGKTIIAKPQYDNGNIILVEKDAVKIYNINLELLKSIEIDGLNEIIGLEWVGDVLKLSLPHNVDQRKITRQVFVNLINDKSISHIRIEVCPYCTPTTFIGHDSTEQEFLRHGGDEDSLEPIDFHFYDSEFNLIKKVQANFCNCVDGRKGCIFFLRTKTDARITRQIFSVKNGSVKEVEYDFVKYHHKIPYGYGVNTTKERMEFLDKNLEIVIPNFEYKKYHLDLDRSGFNYFIVNDYVCVINRFVDECGQSQCRTIIQKANGEVVLDSTKHQCYAIGNSIQIVNKGQSQFLNTITGEIDTLEIKAPITKKGEIDLTRINNIKDIFRIGANSTLMLGGSIIIDGELTDCTLDISTENNELT